jgi:hypothetical protein
LVGTGDLVPRKTLAPAAPSRWRLVRGPASIRAVRLDTGSLSGGAWKRIRKSNLEVPPAHLQKSGFWTTEVCLFCSTLCVLVLCTFHLIPFSNHALLGHHRIFRMALGPSGLFAAAICPFLFSPWTTFVTKSRRVLKPSHGFIQRTWNEV